MPQDFNMRVGVTAEVDKSKIQAQITKETKNIDINVNVKVDKAEAQKAVQKVFDKDKLDKQGREYFTKTTGILKQVKDYYKKNGAISIDISNQQKANGQIKSFTATVTEATGVIKKFNYERGKINTGGTKANYGFVQTDNVGVLDKLSGTKLKQTDDFLSKIQTRISDINSKTFNQSKPLLSVENSDKYNTVLTNTQDRITSITKSTKILSDDHKREIGTMIADLDRYRKELQNVEYAGTKLKPDTFTDTKAILQSQLGTNIQKWDSSNIFDGNFKKNVLDAKNLLDNATNPEGLDKYRAKLKLLNEDFKQTKQSSKDQQSLLNLKSDKDILKNQITTYMNQNTKATKIFGNELVGLQNKLKNVSNATDLKNIKKEFSSIKSEATALGVSGQSFLEKFKGDIGNFATFLSAGTLIMSFVHSVKEGAEFVYELDDAMTNINYTMDVTTQDLKNIGNSSIDMAKDLNTSAKNVLEAVKLYANANETAQTILQKAQPAIMLSNVTGMSGTESAEMLQSIMNQFDLTQGDLMGISDTIQGISQNMAHDFSDGIKQIAEGISESGSVAKDAGLSLQEYSSMLGLVIEQTGQSGSTVGNAMKTILTRVTKASVAAGTLTEDISKAEGSLRSVGVEVRDSAGEFRDMTSIMGDLGKVWNGLDSVTQSNISFNMAGTRQTNILKSLLNNWTEYESLVESANSSSGTTLKNQEKYADSLKGKFSEIGVLWESIWNRSIDSSALKYLADVGIGISELIDNIGLLNVGLIALSGFLGAKTILGVNAFAESLQGLSVSLGFTSTATGTLLASLSIMLPVIVALGAITLAKKAFDEYNITVAETQSKIDELSSSIKSLQSEYDILSQKQDLTEYDKKKLDYLERRLALDKEILNMEQKEKYQNSVGTTASDVFDEDSLLSKKYSEENKRVKTSYAGINYAIGGDVSDLDETTSKIEKLENANKNLNKESYEYKNNQEEINSLTSKQSELYDGLAKYQDELLKKQSDFLDYANEADEAVASGLLKGDDLSKAQEMSSYWHGLYDEVTNTLDHIGYSAGQVTNNLEQTMSGSTDTISQFTKTIKSSFEDTFDASTFASAKDELLALAEAGKLSEDTLSSTDKYKSLLDDTGLSAEELVKYIQGIADSTLSFSEASEALSASQSAISDLKDEVKDTKSISVDTINSLISKYPQLSNVFMDYLNGVKTEKDVITSLTGVYNTDLENYKTLCLGKKIYDTDFYNSVLQKLPTWVSDLASSYGVDLSNFKSLAEAKAAVEENLVKASMKMWAKYYDKVANAEADSSTDEGIRNEKFLQIAAAKREAAKSITGALDDISIDMSGIKTPTFKADTSGGSGKSKSGSGSSSTDKFSESINFTEQSLTNLANAVDKAQTKLENAKGYDAQKTAIDELLTAQEKLKAGYIKSANGDLSSFNKISGIDKYKSQIKDGATFKSTDFTDEKLYNKVKKAQDLWNNYQDTLKKKSGVNTSIDESQQKLYDNEIAKSENSIEALENRKQDTQNNIDDLEASGKKVSASLYQDKVDYNNKEIKLYKDEIKVIQAKRDAESKGSDAWKEYDNQLQDAQNSVHKLTQENSSLADSIKDVATNVKSAQDAFASLQQEIDYYVGLIKDEDLYIKDGDGNFLGISKDYTTKIGLLKTAFEAAQSNVADLQKQIASLDKSDSKYDDNLSDLTSQLYSALDAQNGYADAIESTVDVIENAEIDALESKKDAYSELISKQKEALQAQKDADDYEKNKTDATKEVTDIQARIAELKKASDTGDREAQKEMEQLQEDLKDKQTALDELQADHKLDLELDALDDSQDAYEDAIDNQIKTTQTLYDQQKKWILENANYTSSTMGTVLANLYSTAQEYGLKLSDNLKTSIPAALSGGTVDLGGTDSGNSNVVRGNSNTASSSNSLMRSILGSISDSNKKQDTSGRSDLNKYLASKGYSMLSKDDIVKLANVLGLSKTIDDVTDIDESVAGKANKALILSKLKLRLGDSMFKTGGYVDARGSKSGSLSDLVKSSGEDGFALVKHGEPILTVEQGKLFKELVGNLPSLTSVVNSSVPNMSNLITNNSSSPTIQINLPANTTINNDAINNYRKLIPELTNAVSEQLMNTSRQFK